MLLKNFSTAQNASMIYFAPCRRTSFNPTTTETLTDSDQQCKDESDVGQGGSAGVTNADGGDVCAYYFWVIAFFFFALAILNFLVLVLIANALGIGPYGMAAIEFLPEEGINPQEVQSVHFTTLHRVGN